MAENKIKVVLTIPDFGTGGAEKMVAELASGINKDKFDVTVFVVRRPTGTGIEKEISKDVKVIYFNKNKGFDLKTLFKIYKTFKDLKPDIIHSHIQSFAYNIPYLMTHNIKMLHTIHNVPEMESDGLRRKLLNSLISCKKVIPVGISDVITQMTNALYKTSCTHTVYNPVDDKSFYPSTKKKDDDVVRFISVGRLEEQKNQKKLLESFAKFSLNNKNSELIILGEGSLESKLKEQLRKLNCDRIHFLGRKDNVPDYLRESDVFILTSAYEGLPMTILEAMACGLPIISSDVGGVADIVHDNGLLIKNYNDTDAYVEACNKMMDKDFREACAKNSLKSVEAYKLNNIVKNYEVLYEKYAR